MKRNFAAKPDIESSKDSADTSTDASVSSLATNEFEQLLKEVQAGSEAAAWTLVETYGPHILRSVRRLVDDRLRQQLDSQDFVQAIWASVFARPQKLHAMRQPAELIAYLAVLTRNTVVDEARRQKDAKKRAISRNQSLSDSMFSREECQQRARQSRPSEMAIAREQWERLAENQPPHYRQIIVLRLHGHTFRAIADELGMSERTVRRVLDQLLHNRVSERSRAKIEKPEN